MKIVAYNKCSLLDYDPYIAAVVFTLGCNMSCAYCHNRDLLHSLKYIGEDLILEHLRKSKMLDALVISGGEPTLQGQLLLDFLQKIRNLSLPDSPSAKSSEQKSRKLRIKLDTNGSNPRLLTKIIESGLVDYIAMDIKATPEKYPQICGLPFDFVKKSIPILRQFGAYEFRTTVYPEISLQELESLCQTYQHDNYFLQQYRRIETDGLIPYDDEILQTIADKYSVKTRGLSVVDMS